MNRSVSVILALSGCISADLPDSARRPTQAELGTVFYTLETWESAGLPLPERCWSLAEGFAMAPMPSGELKTFCLADFTLAGCYQARADGSVFSGETIRVIAWDETLETGPKNRLVVHETVHFAGGCAGVGLDFGHSDPRRWRPDGVEYEAIR